MHIILFLIFGLIVGALARLIVPGTEPGGWATSMVIGVLGSFLGGYVGRLIGAYQRLPRDGRFHILPHRRDRRLTAVYQARCRGAEPKLPSPEPLRGPRPSRRRATEAQRNLDDASSRLGPKTLAVPIPRFAGLSSPSRQADPSPRQVSSHRQPWR